MTQRLLNIQTTLWLLVAATGAAAQPCYQLEQMNCEQLNRGVVALRTGDGQVAVSWRTLLTDTPGEPFDVYRDGRKLNAAPLTKGGTFFLDTLPDTTGKAVVYEVKGGGVDGSCALSEEAPANYLSIPLEKPDGGVTPDGRPYTYSANDASVGDVDGDGQYEIFLKWEPSNAHDNAHAGFTGPVLIDCYKLDLNRSRYALGSAAESVNSEPDNNKVNNRSVNSQLLWRLNLGRNIRAGAHYTQFMVYDFDGDGRAELMVKTADGTRDALGTIIGDSLADWRHGAKDALARTDEERENRRTHRFSGDNKQGRILDGPEYLSVFDGLTGRVLDTKPYVPERGNLRGWGDDHANRSDRFLAAVGYLGNVKKKKVTDVHANGDDGGGERLASAIFCRGYYTRTVIAAWDWDGHKLTNRWTFDTNEPQWASYAGQGNHNLRVADVDGDGLDEITYGSMALDHDGRGLYNTGFGHGDAIHLIADPMDGQLYIWDCHENRRDGSELRNARTGDVVFQLKSPMDVGRCMAADIDPTNPAVEMWSSDSKGIRTMRGELLKPGGREMEGRSADGKDRQRDNTALFFGKTRLSTNFGIWWDGDLLRELLDHETVSKYNWQTGGVDVVQRLEGCQFNNGTKSNPCLQADILGDWREEVIARTPDSSELRIFVSTIPTPFRLNCLMHDIPYRLSVASQNTAYNQPPETGYYIGPDRKDYLK